jgi:hypothetical protein
MAVFRQPSLMALATLVEVEFLAATFDLMFGPAQH